MVINNYSKYLKNMSEWWLTRSRMSKAAMVIGGSYLGLLGTSRFFRSTMNINRDEPPHSYEHMYSDMRHHNPNTTDFGSPMNHQASIDRGEGYMRSRPTHSMPQTAGRVQQMHRDAIGHTYQGASRNRRYMRELFNI